MRPRKQFEGLNQKRKEDFVRVVRDGREQLIHVHDVAVGVVLLEPGEVITCDGVFLSGHNVRCDESSAIGESDAIKKLPYQECIALRNKLLTEFESDSPIGDRVSTSGSPRKNPSSLDSGYNQVPRTSMAYRTALTTPPDGRTSHLSAPTPSRPANNGKHKHRT
jgi:magnesium-transporting ATPase (P-type)